MAAVDQHLRDRALRIDHSFIVQAPAGSGKTELLTQRFLRLLAQIARPEQVLAITFTRKATHEMRERIMLRLAQAQAQDQDRAQGGVPPVAEHERDAVRWAGRVLRRDRELGWRLQQLPGLLQIHTIDGLCARLAGRSPAVGPAAAGLTVIEDASAMYREAAQRLLEDAGWPDPLPPVHDALRRVLVHLQGNTGQLARMLAEMLGRRDQWLNRMGVEHADMQSVLAAQQRVELASLENALGPQQLDELMTRLANLAKDADEPDRVQGFLDALAHADGARGQPRQRLRVLFQALGLVATSEDWPYKPASASRFVVPGKGPGRADELAAIQPLLGAWHDDENARRAFRRFVAHPPLEAPAPDHGTLRDFQLLLKAATAELQVLFAEHGAADFQHVAELAMRALGEESDPGEALLLEDQRLAHILMDEFQDTSSTQVKLLETLVSGWQAGDGRTLFLVGDPMQSIYRFRQADVNLFKRAFTTGRLGGLPIESLRLESNFRSSREVIDFVNEQFHRIFPPAGDAGLGAVEYTAVRAERHDGGEVKLQAWPESLGDAEETRMIADLVAAQCRARPGASIAVLARKRVQLAPIAQALRTRGIGFDAVQTEHLGDRPVVQDLLAFTRAIIHPADRIAWLALLRAPWCALSPAELETVAGNSRADNILARMGDPSVLDQLRPGAARRVAELHATMQALMNERGRVPLHRLAESAWLACGGVFVVASRAELDNAQAYLDLLAQLAAEPWADLVTSLVERLGKLYAPSTNAGIQLMTIHKAKGLEFDIVILPGLHQRAGGANQPLLRIQELPMGDGSGVLMAPLRRKGAAGPDLYDYLAGLDQEQEAREAARTLYVAATRARKELHLFGAWKMQGPAKRRKPGCNSGSFMAMLWPCFREYVNDEPGVNAADESVFEPPVLPQLKLRSRPDLPALQIQQVETDPLEMRIPDRKATALGEAFHLWLQLMHDHWSDHWGGQWTPEWLKAHPGALDSSLARAGAAPAELPELRRELLSLLIGVLRSREARAVVNPDAKAISSAELALCSREGMQLRRHVLDRLYADRRGDLVVIDYKTGATGSTLPGDWLRQLRRYQDCVRALTDREVRARILVARHPRPDIVQLDRACRDGD